MKERAFYSPLGGGGLLMFSELLSENHHKINLSASEDLLLNEGLVSLLCITSHNTSLS